MGFTWLHYVCMCITDDVHTRAPRDDARRLRARLGRRVRPRDRSRPSSSSSLAVPRSTLARRSRARRARTRSARATRRDATDRSRPSVATRETRDGLAEKKRARSSISFAISDSGVGREASVRDVPFESNRTESNRTERQSSCRARWRLARRVSRARRRLHRARRSRTSSRCHEDARGRREEARTGRPSHGAR